MKTIDKDMSEALQNINFTENYPHLLNYKEVYPGVVLSKLMAIEFNLYTILQKDAKYD